MSSLPDSLRTAAGYLCSADSALLTSSAAELERLTLLTGQPDLDHCDEVLRLRSERDLYLGMIVHQLPDGRWEARIPAPHGIDVAWRDTQEKAIEALVASVARHRDGGPAVPNPEVLRLRTDLADAEERAAVLRSLLESVRVASALRLETVCRERDAAHAAAATADGRVAVLRGQLSRCEQRLAEVDAVVRQRLGVPAVVVTEDTGEAD